ncbi:hypothetical protein PUN28_013341 [Cardiocondyla obscurior]|uniref:Uncharacterized protein n=1 Tax=Cardiocondyla obscurior TaxID=286306 RepID=A0AAW2FDL3_9HYME
MFHVVEGMKNYNTALDSAMHNTVRSRRSSRWISSVISVVGFSLRAVESIFAAANKCHRGMSVARSRCELIFGCELLVYIDCNYFILQVSSVSINLM